MLVNLHSMLALLLWEDEVKDVHSVGLVSFHASTAARPNTESGSVSPGWQGIAHPSLHTPHMQMSPHRGVQSERRNWAESRPTGAARTAASGAESLCNPTWIWATHPDVHREAETEDDSAAAAVLGYFQHESPCEFRQNGSEQSRSKSALGLLSWQLRGRWMPPPPALCCQL